MQSMINELLSNLPKLVMVFFFKVVTCKSILKHCDIIFGYLSFTVLISYCPILVRRKIPNFDILVVEIS